MSGNKPASNENLKSVSRFYFNLKTYSKTILPKNFFFNFFTFLSFSRIPVTQSIFHLICSRHFSGVNNRKKQPDALVALKLNPITQGRMARKDRNMRVGFRGESKAEWKEWRQKRRGLTGYAMPRFLSSTGNQTVQQTFHVHHQKSAKTIKVSTAARFCAEKALILEKTRILV